MQIKLLNIIDWNMVIASQLSRLAAGSAVVAGAMVANQQRQSAKAADSYPPNGLSPGVQGLPEWIRLGCGSTWVTLVVYVDTGILQRI